jgi:thymidylate synthase
MHSFSSMDQVQHWILSSLLREGTEVAPRGLHTKELQSVQFRLENPRARCVANAERRWSLAVALGEFAWHAGGEQDLGHLTYYVPRWADFSDDHKRVLGSCYGWRIFRPQERIGSQWDRLVRLLRTDRESRRAVLTLHSSSLLLDASVKDSPCALALQFFIRQDRLDAVGMMRSNDAIWGLPYDVFLFTMLQELLAAQLGVSLGSYIHIAGSMHLYRQHLELAQRIIDGPIADESAMQAMDKPDQLPLFLAYEAWLRNQTDQRPETRFSVYWRNLLDVLESFARTRRTDVPVSVTA